ncbi:hypothetical protein BT69DRAFT_1355822 [Atractiella rhizophila]|nr:hypothetical protein BT69DRAFT_1355822 [Atractiella rhizophila]
MASRLSAIVAALAQDPDSLEDPYGQLADALFTIFFPHFTPSAIPQFYVLSALLALLLVVCAACVWVRRNNLKPFHREGEYLVPNAAIVFSAFIAGWLIVAQPTLWRTIKVFKHEGGYKYLLLLRGICWTFLWTAGYYKGYCTLLSTNLSSRATQVTSPQTGPRRTKSGVILTFLVPFLFIASMSPVNVWADRQCNRSYDACRTARHISLKLRESPPSDARVALAALSDPLNDFTHWGAGCEYYSRVLYGMLSFWILFLIVGGAIPFFLLQKKIHRQIQVLERIDHDVRNLRKSQQLDVEIPDSVAASAERARELQGALFNLQIQALAFFGCSACYLASSLVIAYYGMRAQTSATIFAFINLFDFWTFVVFGSPSLIASLWTGITRGSFIGASAMKPFPRRSQARDLITSDSDAAKGTTHALSLWTRARAFTIDSSEEGEKGAFPYPPKGREVDDKSLHICYEELTPSSPSNPPTPRSVLPPSPDTESPSSSTPSHSSQISWFKGPKPSTWAGGNPV